MDIQISLLALALSLPHILYMFIWFRPKFWQTCFEQPIDTFAQVAVALKVLQFSSFLAWYYYAKQPGPILELQQLHAGNIFIWIIFIAAGQVLNVGIYHAIGRVGVYYGFKLGRHVPWVNGFPFNVVSHPQYVGSVLSVWSIPALVWQQRPTGLLPITAFWTALYALTAVQEQYF